MTSQRPVEIHPEAIAEASAARQWYADRNVPASRAFEAELDRAVAAIGESPSRFMRHVAGTRRFVMQRLPYSVVYVELTASVLILAVAHAKRRPGYWRARLPEST